MNRGQNDRIIKQSNNLSFLCHQNASLYMKLEAFVTNLGKYNEGELVGEWVEFPVSDDEIEDILERIGIDGEEYEEYFITDYEADFHAAEILGEYVTLETLNEIAEAIENTSDETTTLAVIEAEVPRNAQELLDCIESADDYYVITYDAAGGDKDSDLAWYYIDMDGIESLGRETLERYFDYESFGRDLSFDFTRTDYGWVSNQ